MFRYKLQQFMYGRYGFDSFSFALCIVSVVLQLLLSIISMFIRSYSFITVWYVLRLVALSALIFAVFRTLSRNIPARTREREWYDRIVEKFRSKRRNSYNGYGGYNNYNNGAYSSYGYDYNKNRSAKKVKYKEDKKTYKYFKCKQCSTKLRVPKGKGKLNITCPKCHYTFKGRS